MAFKNEVEAVNELSRKFDQLRSEVKKRIYGQDEIIDQVLVAMFSRGHCLLIGVPGLAKTLLVNTISEVLGLQYKRIQFTPDLMPSDIIGTEILDKDREFKFIRGPNFRKHYSGRRNQPYTAQNSGGFARSHAGTFGYSRWSKIRTRQTILCSGNTKPY